MPNMFTNSAPVPHKPSGTTPPSTACVSSYEEYAAQRKQDPVLFSDLRPLTVLYKSEVTDRLVPQNVEMGEYFVIPRTEIEEMLRKSPNASFVHVICGIRNSPTTPARFPVTILAPVQKITRTDGTEVYEVCQASDSVYIESYPCPPDPRCPTNELLGTFLPMTHKLNDFKSLF